MQRRRGSALQVQKLIPESRRADCDLIFTVSRDVSDKHPGTNRYQDELSSGEQNWVDADEVMRTIGHQRKHRALLASVRATSELVYGSCPYGSRTIITEV